MANAADKYGITLYCIPSNTTHELQPMDKAVFKPFETFWDDEILFFFDRNKSRDVRNSDFGMIFSRVWTRTMTASNIMSGFRATGIYPFDPHIIPDEAFALNFLNLLYLLNLQRKVASTPGGNWFQLFMVLFTKEYLRTSVLCFLVLIFRL
jgi:hypothetical protein